MERSGSIFASLRKEAGYTQKSLADVLHVTDKAVSKWERGICLPDAALLTQLSALLDADIEYLISNENGSVQEREQWVGEIRINNLQGEVAGRPIVNFLISYLMLVGITEIIVKTSDEKYLKGFHFEKYGVHLHFDELPNKRRIIIYDTFILFGVNLTRQFQSLMLKEKTSIPKVTEREIPMIFSHQCVQRIEVAQKEAVYKNLGRGMVFIPIKNEQQKEDASRFVEIYERYSPEKIADLQEIAVKRGLI